MKFNSSVPVDIISYTKLKDQQNINPKTKIWDVDNIKYVPNTLLKNVTSGTVNFNASGILAHNEKGQHYKVTFTINDISITDNRDVLTLGPLINIFR